MFTGDGSGEFLYAALHRGGLANQPVSRARDDLLVLRGAFITAACRCVPPQNRPAKEELARCAPFLDHELAALRRARVLLALGAIAWEACLGALARAGHLVPRPRPRFAHGAEWRVAGDANAGGPAVLLASYHVSRQNTQTGKLTPAMLDAVISRALAIAR
jgi:uracil-DNA glycosylase family 4